MKRGMDRLGVDISIKSAERMCLQKRTWPTKNAARDFAKRGQKIGNASCTPYQCPLCGRWHLTSLNADDSAAARKKAWK